MIVLCFLAGAMLAFDWRYGVGFLPVAALMVYDRAVGL